jgi:hypothetical protein
LAAANLYPATVEQVREAVLPAGLGLGLLLVVIGLVLGNYGLAGLGVVVALAAYFGRRAD